MLPLPPSSYVIVYSSLKLMLNSLLGTIPCYVSPGRKVFPTKVSWRHTIPRVLPRIISHSSLLPLRVRGEKSLSRPEASTSLMRQRTGLDTSLSQLYLHCYWVGAKATAIVKGQRVKAKRAIVIIDCLLGAQHSYKSRPPKLGSPQLLSIRERS